jgi:Tol biopolymer transport system component
MDADGSNQGVLVDQGILWCCPQAYTWSPDGSQIAYEEYLSEGSGGTNMEISTVTLAEGIPQNVTNHAASDTEPAWQPRSQARWWVYVPFVVR